MKLTKLGPTQNFAAVNPPDWMRHDLGHFAAACPGFRLLTLFADDLPFIDQMGDPRAEFAREATLQTLCKEHLGIDDPARTFRSNITQDTLGSINYNVGRSASHVINDHLTGLPMNVAPPVAPPTAAILILPPRRLQAHEFVSRTLRLPDPVCARLDNVNFHRAVLGHEKGHALNWLASHRRIVPRADERKADNTAVAVCREAGDHAAADFLVSWRILSNLLIPVSATPQADGTAAAHERWHSLSLAGVKAGVAAEYAAHIEVKLRSLNSRIDPTVILPFDRAGFIRSGFNALAQFEHAASCPGPLERIRNLEAKHPLPPYRYLVSDVLASQTIRAASQLAPGVFK